MPNQPTQFVNTKADVKWWWWWWWWWWCTDVDRCSCL